MLMIVVLCLLYILFCSMCYNSGYEEGNRDGYVSGYRDGSYGKTLKRNMKTY